MIEYGCSQASDVATSRILTRYVLLPGVFAKNLTKSHLFRSRAVYAV